MTSWLHIKASSRGCHRAPLIVLANRFDQISSELLGALGHESRGRPSPTPHRGAAAEVEVAVLAEPQ